MLRTSEFGYEYSRCDNKLLFQIYFILVYPIIRQIMEWDYSPLSTACVRSLNDKLYEKRRAAALEIEKMVKEFAAVNNTLQIKKLLKVLGQDFAYSKNPNTKKGGLIGLAAVAVALGKETSAYMEDLIKPILCNFSDSDLRVRYYACESLYNVIKVAREAVLPYFGDVFEALSKLAADPDQNVKNASELLDRLMKDIVTENRSFDLESSIPLLRERIYTTNPFACQFIISWISALADTPHIDLLRYLPEILDGLFHILAEPTVEIKKMCESVLCKFLRNIRQEPQRINFVEMINIITIHSQSNDHLLQFTALTWIKEFVQLSGPLLLPFVSSILVAILPCLSYEQESSKHIKDTAKTINFTLMKLISNEEDQLLDESGEKITKSNIDLESITEVLCKYLSYNSVETKVTVLRWITLLHTNVPNRMLLHMDQLFPLLLRTLSDQSDKVVHCDLKVLSSIISHPTSTKVEYVQEVKKSEELSSEYTYFNKFIANLLRQFRDKELLEERGSFVIRDLCVLLNSEDIYKALADILLYEEDLNFASMMVQQLNMILLTSSELFHLRTNLKELKLKESRSLFHCLYKTWCHNPVATVSLCFLTQNYQHACDVIRIFSELEITVQLLTEIDKLVQLIESPIFTYLRLELLKIPYNQFLVCALYGLLMILPQSDAFHMLRNRLDCIPKLQLFNDTNVHERPKKNDSAICFEDLLKHFVSVQNKHKEYRMKNRVSNLSDVDGDL